jgi:phage terminase small subunit
MPVLKNARHERFAQALAKGMTADEAYKEAGFKPNRGNAATLKANQSISKRVTELQAKVAEKAKWTAADRIAALQRIAEKAEEGDPKVTISAISEANKMDGSHAASKHEHKGQFTVVNVTPDQLSRLSPDELAALDAAYPVLQKLGVVPTGDPGGAPGEGSEQAD